ncbi:MAG: pyridoxine 5'-phosphate synthase [Candidatus Zixiibacteriota bacterium]
MALLSVNLDQVAALREVRKRREPDPAQAAVMAELAGADGIAIALRRDRKYIRDRDLYILREVVKTRLIIEVPPTEEIIARVLEVKPAMVTLVADHADPDLQVSGIDFHSAPVDFSDVAGRFKGAGIGVCFFVEPEPDTVKGAAKAGADAVLINCGSFTLALTLEEAQRELDRIDNAAQAASKAGLSVYAGRGINSKNVMALHELGLFDEFFVGHSIISQALLAGMTAAVAEMLAAIRTDVREG